jgi:hypothetical protein
MPGFVGGRNGGPADGWEGVAKTFGMFESKPCNLGSFGIDMLKKYFYREPLPDFPRPMTADVLKNRGPLT